MHEAVSEALAPLAERDLVLGRYRPLRPLGSGGSGSVWLARDERSGLDIALKIVTRDGKAGERAEREAAAAARLRHPRCLRAYAFGRDRGHVYIAYEYAAGRTLREAMRAGELDDRTAIEAAAQILEGLAHAHANGIVHRDVKPANALLTESDGIDVRLLDFGLARIADAHTLTARGDVPGTLAYIAPERLAGEPGGAPGDVWSVGVLLWEALTGQHPFWRSSPIETARAIEAGAPSLAVSRPDLPAEVVAAVDGALAREPAARPPAALLATRLRGARTRRKKPVAVPASVRLGLEPLLAALVAGWTVAMLPFFPAAFVPAMAALAGVTTALRTRLGVALTLAVPVLPLGNHSLALGVIYTALALAWFAAFWREPRSALSFAVGPPLALVSALALLPLALTAIGTPVRRALAALGALTAAALVAGIRGSPLPLTGEAPPQALGVARSESLSATGSAIWSSLVGQPELILAGLAITAAAALLPIATRFGRWGIAGFGMVFMACTLLPAPTVSALPVVLSVWATCVIVCLRPSG